MKSALSGLTCLDFSMGVAGPHAGMLCAQHGADVIKIETQEGDWARRLGTQYGDLSAYSAVYNRNKRSLAIDLKDADARDLVRKQAMTADVIIEAFRPGVMKKFGLDYETVSAGNPGVIYLSVTGFGQEGPMSHLPATDAVMQAFSGFMQLNRDRAGTPQRVDMILIDVITGLYGFQAITTGLMERASNGGQGKYVDCSLMQSAIAFQTPKIVEHELGGGPRAMYVPLGYVATKDGGLSISVMHNHHFIALCKVLGHEEFGTNPRYGSAALRIEHEAEVMRFVREEFKRHSTLELSALLSEAGVLNAQVLAYPEVVRHPQVEIASAVAWVKQDGFERPLPLANIPGAPATDGPEISPAPHIGQHSREILDAWGIEPAAVDGLVARGAVGCG